MIKKLLMGILMSVSFFMDNNLYAFNRRTFKNNIKIEQARDFQKIEKKKEVFIETLIPIIDEIRDDIRKEKIYAQILESKSLKGKKLTSMEYTFLEKMYTKYKVKNKKIGELVLKIQVPPTSFILGQAALESGWGRSKLAKEGNNLFGMRSVTKDSKIAVELAKGQYYKRYRNIQDSVEDYILTLARYISYKNFRKAVRNGENSIQLIKYLANYSEVKNIYAERLETIIRKNKFQQYDKS